MTRTRAGKTVDALAAKIAVLEEQQRELESASFGAELTADAARRDRYFAVADHALRRKLIGIARKIHELRAQHRSAAVAYWTIVTNETRAKLEDLRSDSRNSNWKRGIWWDMVTVFWILAGFGWLTFKIPGAIVGAIAAAIWSRYIARSRAASRIAFLREGDDALRSSESQLRQAERDAEAGAAVREPFTATEEARGVPDGPEAEVAVTGLNEAR